MTEETKKEITEMSKGFTKGIGIPINKSEWLVVDPLSGFLNISGYENTLKQIPATEDHPQVLIMIFKDGSQFIPAGGDLNKAVPGSKNWMWL